MKFSIFTISFLFSVLYLTRVICPAVCPAPIPAEYASVKPGNIVAAYFASWDIYGQHKYEVEDIYPIADKLTHIVYAFAKPDVQTGACVLHDPWADLGANSEHRKKVGGNFGKLLALKKKFPHIKILLSIGGGTYSKDISTLVEKGLVDTFVNSCMQLLDHYRYTFINSQTKQQESHLFEYPELFDGIDLDWEWLFNVVPEKDAQAFVHMNKLFRNLLDKRAARNQQKKSLLTVALQVNAAVYTKLSLATVASYVDWFHVMAYNFAGPASRATGFNAPICNPWSAYSIDAAITGLMNAGVSPNKLVLGIPLYGHVFDDTNGRVGMPFAKTELTGPKSYERIKDLYLSDKGCRYTWHEKSKVPYLYCSDDKVFVSFDNERSVKEKAAYAKNKLLKGIVLWKLSGDDKEHNLLRAMV